MQISSLGEDVSWAWRCGSGHGTWLVLNPLSTDMRVVGQGALGLWGAVGYCGSAPAGKEGMMMLVVVSEEGAERDVVPVARCCGQCREEAGAGGRRGWCRAEAGLPCGVAVDGSTWDRSVGATVGHARWPEPRLPRHAKLHSMSQLSNKTSWCTLMFASPFLWLRWHSGLGVTWMGVAWLRKPHRDREGAGPVPASRSRARVGNGPLGWGSTLLPIYPASPRHPRYRGSEPRSKRGRWLGPRSGSAAPSRAQDSCHVVSYPLE